LPDFSTNSINAVDVLNTANSHTMITYDAMGRVVETVNPDGSRSNIEYDDWSTSTINANGHKQKSIFDAYGRLIQKIEYKGADGRANLIYPFVAYTPYATTQYVYDSEGNLTNTVDAHNNLTTIGYDNLGRKISMNDPDMGSWTYSYDLNGNLKMQTDAKGSTIDFTYDTLNRLTNKTDLAQLNVNYTYDDNATNFSIGRLTQAEYPDSTDFYYDALGREITSVKSIGSSNYQVNRDYDATNSLLKVEYPDGKNVFYEHNVAGQIESVSNDESLFPEDGLSPPELDTIEVGNSKVRLTWASVAGASNYTIHYGLSTGNYPNAIPVGNATTNIVSQLSNGTIYYFVVTATDAENVVSANSYERSASPAALVPISVAAPIIHYTLNDNASNSTVIDTLGGFDGETSQISNYTSNLANGGTASASSCLEGCGSNNYAPYQAFNGITTWPDGWNTNSTPSGWVRYTFSSPQKITKYVIYPRAHIPGNPTSWTFEGYDGINWDILDTRSGVSGWAHGFPKIFDGFTNNQAYQKYQLNISNSGGQNMVGVVELEMMGFTPIYTNAVTATGKINNAFSFDASYRVNIEDMVNAVKFHNTGSISFWVKGTANGYVMAMASSTSTTHYAISLDGNLNLTLKLDGSIAMKARGSTNLTDGSWHHAALVQDGLGIKLYVDGVEDALNSTQGDLTAWINDVNYLLDSNYIGGAKAGGIGDVFFNGSVDDFRYYDYPLTPLEVEAIYNNGEGTEEENPQYLPPDPLASLEAEDKQYFVARDSSLVAQRSLFVNRDTRHGSRGTNILATITKFYTQWFEPNILGIKEAYAQGGTVDQVSFQPADSTINVGETQTLTLEALNTVGQTLKKFKVEYLFTLGLDISNIQTIPSAKSIKVDQNKFFPSGYSTFNKLFVAS